MLSSFQRSWIKSSIYRFSCTSGFLLGDLLDRTLDFWDIHFLIVNFDHTAENSSHFGELILVSCDEVELGESHNGLIVLRKWDGQLDKNEGGSTEVI